MRKRLAVIGAGPIGLEAALAAMERGYDTTVIERGEVGDHIRRWRHVSMFSPFGMNASARGRERLRQAGRGLPADDALLTGGDFVEAYLAPLAALMPIRAGIEVVSVARSGTLKGEKIAAPERSDTPFNLLLARDGEEWTEKADLIFDCTGTFSTPNPLGDGGMSAPGERLCRDRIHYGVPDVVGALREQFTGRRVLLIGGGHSAATVAWNLARLENVSIVWAARKNHAPPCLRVDADPLPARDHLAQIANALVASRAIDFRPGRSVLALRPIEDEIAVTLATSDGAETVEVDCMIAAVGFRPDFSLTRELQIQTCWATEGTYPLAASLLGETGGDCLAVSGFGAETLIHPEPGYFTLGIKSYGRSPNFLLRTGHEQIENLLQWLDSQ